MVRLPDLPIQIISIERGTSELSRFPAVSHFQHWQVEEFLQQTGKSENTQRTYRGQLIRFSDWCSKSWLDVTPSDIAKYRRHLKAKGLKPSSINHALNTLKSFYQWLRASKGYPLNHPLPTDTIGLERQPEPQADNLEAEELERIREALTFDAKTSVRDRAIVALLSHGLRASEVSALNVMHWNGKRLMVFRSKGQNVSALPLSKEAKQHLEAYLEWRRKQGGDFEPEPSSPMFLTQDCRTKGQRLGYQGILLMVRKLGERSGIGGIHPHRFRHTFGTELTRKGVDPMFGKELMGIKNDRVYQRYIKAVFKDAAAIAYLKAIGETEED